jgi:hypothetical protein
MNKVMTSKFFTLAIIALSVGAPLAMAADPAVQGNQAQPSLNWNGAGESLKKIPDAIYDQAAALREKMQGDNTRNPDDSKPATDKPVNSANNPDLDLSRIAKELQDAKQSVENAFRDASDNWNRTTTGFRDGAKYLLDQLDSMADWTRRQVANARNYL